MIDVKKGLTAKPASSQILIECLEGCQNLDGHLYIGYPILFSGEGDFTVDALLISPQIGVVVFDLIETVESTEVTEDRQDLVFSLIDSQLRAHKDLKKSRRELAVPIEIISYAPGLELEESDDIYCVSGKDKLLDLIEGLSGEWDSAKLFDRVVSIIQSVISLKIKTKRNNVKKKDSKGARIKQLEDTIATLDRNQEKAVIEYFEGVQRLRGLAGSGKTIVLALKAAYLHTQNPDWLIAVTFNTRSLKEQFKELITRFCVEKKRVLPDWEKIRVINAWGRSSDKTYERGLYFDFCAQHEIEYLDYRSAKNYAYSEGRLETNIFSAACNKALDDVLQDFRPKYNAILVDEAQDLSEEFLKMCYEFLHEPKRLIYAYDELQKLNEGSSLGNPHDFLINDGREFDDTILRICYRNSRPLLVAAHALGFGVYRKNDQGKRELVQFFDQPQLWKDVGYRLKEGGTRVRKQSKIREK